MVASLSCLPELPYISINFTRLQLQLKFEHNSSQRFTCAVVEVHLSLTHFLNVTMTGGGFWGTFSEKQSAAGLAGIDLFIELSL